MQPIRHFSLKLKFFSRPHFHESCFFGDFKHLFALSIMNLYLSYIFWTTKNRFYVIKENKNLEFDLLVIFFVLFDIISPWSVYSIPIIIFFTLLRTLALEINRFFDRTQEKSKSWAVFGTLFSIQPPKKYCSKCRNALKHVPNYVSIVRNWADDSMARKWKRANSREKYKHRTLFGVISHFNRNCHSNHTYTLQYSVADFVCVKFIQFSIFRTQHVVCSLLVRRFYILLYAYAYEILEGWYYMTLSTSMSISMGI